ncbi:hypothetical protein GCM10020219_014840 [Nonomuraea dietziae]
MSPLTGDSSPSQLPARARRTAGRRQATLERFVADGFVKLPAAAPPSSAVAQAVNPSAREAITGAAYTIGNGMWEYQRALVTVTTAPAK